MWLPGPQAFPGIDAVIFTDSCIFIIQSTVYYAHTTTLQGIDQIASLLPDQFRRGRRRCCVFISHDDWNSQVLGYGLFKDLNSRGISVYTAVLEAVKMN